jgi:versiconal hemiacetal acetate esterase
LGHLTFPTPDPSVKTIDKEISPNLKVRIYTPPDYNVDKPKPVAVSFHGGGWAMGDLDAEDIQFRTISKSANIVLVSADYRLAPANPYPAALNDCITVYHWALKNTDSLNTVPNQVILFGLSAGANLALCAALKID